MTEDERTRLVQQINMGANLHSHQMDAVMGALTHLGWRPSKQESEMTQTDTPARCEPPEGTHGCTAHILTDGTRLWVAVWTDASRWMLAGENGSWSPEDVARNKGYRYSHAVPMDPPVVDPHAALRDEVVEAAGKARVQWTKAQISALESAVYSQARGALFAAVDRLAAAMSPPDLDPADRLAKAWDAVRCAAHGAAGAEMGAAVKAAIAALGKGAGA
jgi:hypothetical protein